MSIAIYGDPNLSPPPFSQGLDQWSKGDGSLSSNSYADDDQAVFVPSDADFGGALEFIKSSNVQTFRARFATPLRAGNYLRMSAQIKLLGGSLPSVRMSILALDGGKNALGSYQPVLGGAVQIYKYGEIYTITAVISTSKQDGVDITLPLAAKYFRFGLEFSGRTGARIRMDDIVGSDVSAEFLSAKLSRVDVRDYGAIGDGATDNHAAFIAADAAANGRELFVPSGTYYIGQSLYISSPIAFEGQVKMPQAAVLRLLRSYRFSSYARAFGSEEMGFHKAFQALLNNSDHSTLDLEGRRISLSKTADLAALAGGKTSFVQRRVIKNGEFVASEASDWPVGNAVATASYDPKNPLKLTNVTGLSAISEGALVEGAGVGREVYVKSIDAAKAEITLSLPLHGGAVRQKYTFTRFNYLLDFSGFDQLRFFQLENIEFRCGGRASGVLLPKEGRMFRIAECSFTYPKNRAITSSGAGCAGLSVDRCLFETNEWELPASDRQSVAINCNSNDVKIRNNWASQFRHFLVLAGGQSIVSGNHFFQDDNIPSSPRLAGIIITRLNCLATLTDNYVDNAVIEWTNEHNPYPDYNEGSSFCGLTFANNICLSGNSAPWFSFLVIKPFGENHRIESMTVTGNDFLAYETALDRVDNVDSSIAALNLAAAGSVVFAGNNYQGINIKTQNPLMITHAQKTPAKIWGVSAQNQLPFAGPITAVRSVVLHEGVKTQSGAAVFSSPQVAPRYGDGQQHLALHWPEACQGTIAVQAVFGTA